MTGTRLSGSVVLGRRKRTGVNAIDSYFFGSRFTSRAFLSNFDRNDNLLANLFGLGFPAPHPREALPASSNSGGAVFIVDGAEFLLAGVNSFVLPLPDLVPDSDYSDLSGANCVGRYNDWIDGVVGLGALDKMQDARLRDRPFCWFRASGWDTGHQYS